MANTGIVNLTDTRALEQPERVRALVFEWIADTSGDAEERFSVPLDGFLICIVTLPRVGDQAPDANYDITIKDEWNTDILDGLAANRHTANQERVGLDIEPMSRRSVRTPWFTFTVANAGSENSGVAKLYMV